MWLPVLFRIYLAKLSKIYRFYFRIPNIFNIFAHDLQIFLTKTTKMSIKEFYEAYETLLGKLYSGQFLTAQRVSPENRVIPLHRTHVGFMNQSFSLPYNTFAEMNILKGYFGVQVNIRVRLGIGEISISKLDGAMESMVIDTFPGLESLKSPHVLEYSFRIPIDSE